VQLESTSSSTTISNNNFSRLKKASIWSKGAPYEVNINSNVSYLSLARPTASLQPVHILGDGNGGIGPSQWVINGNMFIGGWRGYAVGVRSDCLTNTEFTGNRFISLWGAAIVGQGAGNNTQGNYLNTMGAGAGPSLSCDASCNAATRGTLCQQDSDCTSCSGNYCETEPLMWVGNPQNPLCGTTHYTALSNLVFNGSNAYQCTTGSGSATNPGALCDFMNTCNGGGRAGLPCNTGSDCPTTNDCSGARVGINYATCAADTGFTSCSGGPPATCHSSGPVNGHLCCAGSGSNSCAVRTPAMGYEFTESTAAICGSFCSHNLANIQGNTIFQSGRALTNWRGIEISANNLGNQAISDSHIASNLFSGSGIATAVGIHFPTTVRSITNLNIVGNSFAALSTDIQNAKGTYGPISFNPIMVSLPADQSTSSTSFVNISGSSSPLQVNVGANRNYFFTCELTFSSNSTSTGIGFSMNTTATYSTFSMITRIPTASVAVAAGTDVMQEQEGNGNDSTATTSIGVGSAFTKYMANVRGNLITTGTAGVLTARVKAENASTVTVFKGSNCVVQQMP